MHNLYVLTTKSVTGLIFTFYIHEANTFFVIIFVNLNVPFSFYALIQVIRTWGVRNNIDILSLYTRHAQDICHVRNIPDKFYPINFITCLSIFSNIPLDSIFSFWICFVFVASVFRLVFLSILKRKGQTPTFFILQAREFLSNLGDIKQTHIFAKIENIEVRNFKIFWIVDSPLLREKCYAV